MNANCTRWTRVLAALTTLGLLPIFVRAQQTPGVESGQSPIPIDIIATPELHIEAFGHPFWSEQWKRGTDPKVLSRYDLRAELADTRDEFFSRMGDSGLLLDDPVAHDYLYALLTQIHPTSFFYGRPGQFNVRILVNSEPNAWVFDDGTVLVTSGLISRLRTENELMAVLSHELAHVVHDHAVKQLVDYEDAQRRAEERAKAGAFFNTVFATAIVALGSHLLSRRTGTTVINARDYGSFYRNSYLFALNAALSAAQMTSTRFSQTQESTADFVARDWLVWAGRDTTSIGVALLRIRDLQMRNGTPRGLASHSSHPSLVQRLTDLYRIRIVFRQTIRDDVRDALITRPPDFKGFYINETNFVDVVSHPAFVEAWNRIDHSYDAAMATVLTRTAFLDIVVHDRFEEGMALVDRVIAAGWASGTDHLLKAIALRKSRRGSAEEISKHLSIAEDLGTHHTDILYTEIALDLMRRGRHDQALQALDEIKFQDPEPHWHEMTKSRLRGRIAGTR